MKIENFAEKLQAIIRDRSNLVACANRCNKAYSEGAGYDYSPFTEEDAETVAQNYAGLQAVVTGVTMFASLANRVLDEEGYTILNEISTGNLDPKAKEMLHRIANATWGAGQPFRTDKGPLGRADRVNVFDLLNPEELAKDWVQIQSAAAFLMEKLAA